MQSPFSEFDPPTGGEGDARPSDAGSPFSEFDEGTPAQEETAASASAPARTYAADEEVENATDVTKCPACGANMVYDSVRGKLYCEHCDTVVEVRARTSEEQDFERLLSRTDEWGAETHVFRCENCGAQEVLADGEIAKKCPFCGTTNIVRTDELPGLRPNGVVPFSIAKDDAIRRVRRWARKKLFAPRRFRKEADPENVNGMYMPAFSFDTSARTHGIRGCSANITTAPNA